MQSKLHGPGRVELDGAEPIDVIIVQQGVARAYVLGRQDRIQLALVLSHHMRADQIDQTIVAVQRGYLDLPSALDGHDAKAVEQGEQQPLLALRPSRSVLPPSYSDVNDVFHPAGSLLVGNAAIGAYDPCEETDAVVILVQRKMIVMEQGPDLFFETVRGEVVHYIRAEVDHLPANDLGGLLPKLSPHFDAIIFP